MVRNVKVLPASCFWVQSKPNTQKAFSASGWISHLDPTVFPSLPPLGPGIQHPQTLGARCFCSWKDQEQTLPQLLTWFLSLGLIHLTSFYTSIYFGCGSSLLRGHSLAAARGLSCHSACGSFVMELASPDFLFLFYFKMADIFCQE